MSVTTSERGPRARGDLRAVTLLALLLGAGALCGSREAVSQTAGVNQGGPGYLHSQAGADPNVGQNQGSGDRTIEQMRRAERDRRMNLDLAKLVQLTAELRAQMDQGPKDQLSVDAMRKASEIEKTAHDLIGWMKTP